METRPYFIFGDALSCAVIGALAAISCLLVVGQNWHMFAAMVVGMIIGMVVAIVVGFLLFFWLFGAIEVMIPTMLTGMLSGMVISMAVTTKPYGVGWCAGAGALIGIGVVISTYAANALISGKVET